MNSLQFWFYFILIGGGLGFVAVAALIVIVVRNRPRRKTIFVDIDNTKDAYVDIEYTGRLRVIEEGTAKRIPLTDEFIKAYTDAVSKIKDGE